MMKCGFADSKTAIWKMALPGLSCASLLDNLPLIMSDHLGWYSRDYLPHFDRPGLLQAITFRLADALPTEVLARWKLELAHEPDTVRDLETRRRIEAWIDAGHGACHLRDPRIARLVENALLHFDGQRYRLLAWVIMPNHIHVLIETREDWPMSRLIRSWKTWTSRHANATLGLTGAFWQREYHDRFIRDADHYAAVTHYIENNPVKARLCARAEDWPWSSASSKRRD